MSPSTIPEPAAWLERTKRARIVTTAVEIRCSRPRSPHLVASLHPIPTTGKLRAVALWERGSRYTDWLATYREVSPTERAGQHYARTDEAVRIIALDEFDHPGWLRTSSWACDCRLGVLDDSTLINEFYNWLGMSMRDRPRHTPPRVVRLR